MTRTLIAAAALLATAGLASASDLVPGSDQTDRAEQSRADWSVVAGQNARSDGAQTVYGYQTGERATRDAVGNGESAAPRAPVSASDVVLVPGSDSF